MGIEEDAIQREMGYQLARLLWTFEAFRALLHVLLESSEPTIMNVHGEHLLILNMKSVQIQPTESAIIFPNSRYVPIPGISEPRYIAPDRSRYDADMQRTC